MAGEVKVSVTIGNIKVIAGVPCTKMRCRLCGEWVWAAVTNRASSYACDSCTRLVPSQVGRGSDGPQVAHDIRYHG